MPLSRKATRERLKDQIRRLEAKAAIKPLGPMAQADLEHARAALAALNTSGDYDPYTRGSKRPRREQGPAGSIRIVPGGLPGLGKGR